MLSGSEPAMGPAAAAVRRVPPVTLVLSAMLLFQLGAAIATGLFDSVGPAGTTLLRVAFAATVMGLILRPPVRNLGRPQWRAVLFFGLVLGTMNLLFYEALDRIPLGTTITIQFAGPLMVAVLGRRRHLDLLWVLLAAAGIFALVAPGGSGGDPIGYAFAGVAGAAWGCYIIASARLGIVFPDPRGVALGMAVACIPPLIPGVVALSHAEIGLEVIGLAIVVAMLSSVLPHTLDNEALRRMPSNVFGTLMSLEPAFAALIGAVALSQRLTAREVLGVVLVVVAAVGIMRYRPRVAERL